MNDYAYHQASVSGALSGAGVLARIWDNWRARRAIARLDRLDDFLLHDIGVRREDVQVAARSPLTVNAVSALQELTNARTLRYGRELYAAGRKESASAHALSPFRPN